MNRFDHEMVKVVRLTGSRDKASISTLNYSGIATLPNFMMIIIRSCFAWPYRRVIRIPFLFGSVLGRG